MDAFKSQIAKLEEVHAQGYITDEDFQAKKQLLVDQYVGDSGATTAATSYQAEQATSTALTTTGDGGDCVIKLRGLPFVAMQNDVIAFLNGVNIADPGIKFVLSPDGRHNGTCFVYLVDETDVARALTYNKAVMGERYIEVFKSDNQEAWANTQPTNGEARYIRMRGLPFTAGVADVRQFFGSDFNLDDSAITLTTTGGRASGEAYVQFPDEATARAAMGKDKQYMGRRYVELFLVTAEEYEVGIRATDAFIGARGGLGGGMGGMGLGKSRGTRYGGGDGFGGAYAGTMAGKVGGLDGSGSVRIRGIPFRAQETDIAQFFTGLELAPGGIIIERQMGRPTGQAYVSFKFPWCAEQALAKNHEYMGTRYVEIFPASEAEVRAAAATAGAVAQQPMRPMAAAAARPLTMPAYGTTSYGFAGAYGAAAAAGGYGAYGAYAQGAAGIMPPAPTGGNVVW